MEGKVGAGAETGQDGEQVPGEPGQAQHRVTPHRRRHQAQAGHESHRAQHYHSWQPCSNIDALVCSLMKWLVLEGVIMFKSS